MHTKKGRENNNQNNELHLTLLCVFQQILVKKVTRSHLF